MKGSNDAEHEVLAESYLRRALINAELEGKDLISALRLARRDVAAGKHLEPGSMVDETVSGVIDRLMTFLVHCREAGVSFENAGTTLDAQDVLDGLAYVLGVEATDSNEEDAGIRRGLARTFAMIAGT